jgi:hypothetical protein
MILTKAQLEQDWIHNGGAPAAAPMYAAISLAESGGNTNAVHVNADGSVDRGAAQINSVHGALSTTDRNGNVKAAIKISSNGLNWHPWTTFESGAYRKFLGPPAAGTVTVAKGATPAAKAAGGGTDLFSDKATGLKYAVVWIAIVIAGAAIAGIGVNRALGGAPARSARRVAKAGAMAART